MKKIFALCVLIFSSAGYTELYIYDNEYRNIKVGISSVKDLISHHGKPNRKAENINNINYLYDNFHVTIQNSTGKVNSIIIFDSDYTDPNGIKIGFSKVVIAAVLDTNIDKEYAVSENKGIIYYFENERVSKIVMVHKLKLND